MRILLVDNDAARSLSLAEKLVAEGSEVMSAGQGESIAEAVARVAPDVVIVDMARPDRDSLEGIRRAHSEMPRPIVMFTDRDDSAFMEEAIAAGVSSYNLVGTALPEIKPIVKTAIALFSRYRDMELALRFAENTLRERTMVDQAKSLLMKQRNISEPQAYRWLRSRAMDRGKKIADIAHELLDLQAGSGG